MKIKYKIEVGDKVRIRRDLKRGKCYGGCFVVSDMEKLKGKIVTIDSVRESNLHYRLKEYRYSWTKEMFEAVNDYLTTEEFIKEVKVLGYVVDDTRYEIFILPNGNKEHVVAKVSKNRTFTSDTYWVGHNNLKDEDKEKLHNILDRYIRTPLDKRAVGKSLG